MKKRGRPVPEGHVLVHVLIPSELRAALQHEAEQNDRTLAAEIRRRLRQSFEEVER